MNVNGRNFLLMMGLVMVAASLGARTSRAQLQDDVPVSLFQTECLEFNQTNARWAVIGVRNSSPRLDNWDIALYDASVCRGQEDYSGLEAEYVDFIGVKYVPDSRSLQWDYG